MPGSLASASNAVSCYDVATITNDGLIMFFPCFDFSLELHRNGSGFPLCKDHR